MSIHISCEEVENKIDTLFEAIKHGSEEHRQWLKEAIECHFDDKPIPEYRS